jgi:hypothetical protein
MKTRTLIVLAVLSMLVLAGCTAGPNPILHGANEQGLVAGFWRGLWHGLIAPVSFIISLFTDHVRVYEVHNSGGWYDFGFMLGVSSSLGGSAHGAGRRWRRVTVVSVQKD